jgi:hypothetical protein
MQVVAAAVVGGTASELAGGKFGNGAVTAAFGAGFNQLAHYLSDESRFEESCRTKSLKPGAEDLAYRQEGEDGVVHLSSEEFLDIFRYESSRLEDRFNFLNEAFPVDLVDVLMEAKNQGDSLFYYANGGRTYRVGGLPIDDVGGNINYVNQGLVFAIGGESLDTAHSAVAAWNVSGAGTLGYLGRRLDYTTLGYALWKSGALK